MIALGPPWSFRCRWSSGWPSWPPWGSWPCGRSLARRRLHLRTEADEILFVTAADGWRLALWRIRPRDGDARLGPR